MSESSDLSSYLLGDRSELRGLIEAIAQATREDERARAAAEYLLVLAAARQAASGEPSEEKALRQIQSQYSRVFRGDDCEHARLLQELYSSLRDGGPAALATALKLLGLFHRKSAGFQRARAAFSVASEVARLLPDPIEHLNSLFWLGVVERYLGNLDSAEAVHREQLEKARAVDNRGQAVLAQENLGLVTLRRGDIAGARRRVLRALNEAEEVGDRELEGYCYHALMTVETYADRPGEAAACAWQAYLRYESIDQRTRALQDCGVILFRSGYMHEAKAAFEIVCNCARDTAPRIHALIGLADVAASLGNRREFQSLKERLLSTDSLDSMPFERVNALRTVGTGFARFGEPSVARKYLEHSLRVAEEKGFASEVTEIREEMMDLSVAKPATPPPAPAAEEEQLRSIGQQVMAERARAIA